MLEPVLERCTPEQLYRIEECNHVSALAWERGEMCRAVLTCKSRIANKAF